MKTYSFLALLTLAGSTALFAQYAAPGPAYGPPPAPPTAAFPPQSPDQLDQLVGPIALYPDPLVAILLPAATTPGDLQAADQLVRANTDPGTLDAQPWDESVKALAHYPQLLAWMDDNMPWTQQLGAAFAQQSSDVMNSIQRLRARARDAGILASTPQEQVVMQDNAIAILPAQPDVIYVPSYDPEVLYSTGGYRRSYAPLTFGLSFSTGPWLDYGFNWRDRSVWVDRNQTWNRRGARTYAVQSPTVTAERREWRPRGEVSQRAIASPRTNVRVQIAQPTPMNPTGTWSRERNATSRYEVTPTPRTYAPPLGPAVAPTGRIDSRPEVRQQSTPYIVPPNATPAPQRVERGREQRTEPAAPRRDHREDGKKDDDDDRRRRGDD